MNTNDLLLQRFHDGELTQAEAAGVEPLLAQQPALRAASHQLDALDGLLKAHAMRVQTTNTADLVERIRANLPTTVPKREVQVSVMHVVASVVLACFVAMGAFLADHMKWLLSDMIPMWSLAIIAMACGFSLLIAARPLLHLEAGFIQWMLRRRLAVGDGEVLVCRVFGIALILGGTHIAGLWG
jgi:hypothetical protein